MKVNHSTESLERDFDPVNRKNSKLTKDQLKNAVDGHRIYKEYQTRRETFKWLNEKEEHQHISYEKMVKTVEKTHPRQYFESSHKRPKPYPLSIDTGTLTRKTDQIYEFDKLGVGVSMYFKLLKTLIFYLLFTMFFVLPMIYLYSCGEKSNTA